MNVSGFTSLNNLTTILSSLNVYGFTTLDNDTSINASLYLSGLNVLETLKRHETGLSTLHNFRSDNSLAIIKLDDEPTNVKGINPNNEIKFKSH